MNNILLRQKKNALLCSYNCRRQRYITFISSIAHGLFQPQKSESRSLKGMASVGFHCGGDNYRKQQLIVAKLENHLKQSGSDLTFVSVSLKKYVN